MSLSDREILELNELCNALVDETLSKAQKTRLSQCLAASPEARQFYVRAMGLSASLFDYASEMQVEAPDAASLRPRFSERPNFWRVFGALAATGAVVLILGSVAYLRQEPLAMEMDAESYVAQLTGSIDCQWVKSARALQPGEQLPLGQRLELIQGLAEITFNSGAQITLEGPAVLDLNSAWNASLRQGALKANVPLEAAGFRISNPTVDIVDLGTEFSVVTDLTGVTEVYVLKGRVEATPHDAQGREQPPMVMREDQARRFSWLGTMEVRDHKPRLRRLSKPLKSEQFTQPASYVHWAFDETSGPIARAQVSRLAPASYYAVLESLSPNALDSQWTEGRWGRALRFDGQLVAQATFPDISGKGACTVAFWVKLPEDAALSDTCSMVGWLVRGPEKIGPIPLQIGWNPDPAQGTLGALRTEFGRSCVVGSKSLRDGRWHHVAMVLLLQDRKNGRVHVRQYVDGFLEKATSQHTLKRHRQRALQVAATLESSERLWLGCRPGARPQNRTHFRGELDELFITDRPLIPQEIKQLIKNNKLPQT